MNWEQLLSLKRHGDTNKRLRNEQDETRLGFDVDYDRIIFSPEFRSFKTKHRWCRCHRQILCIPD